MPETKTAQGRAALPAKVDTVAQVADAVAVAFEDATDNFDHINGRAPDMDTVIFWGGVSTYEVIIEVRDGLSRT